MIRDAYRAAHSNIRNLSLLATDELGALVVEELELSVSLARVSLAREGQAKAYVKLFRRLAQRVVVALDKQPTDLLVGRLGVSAVGQGSRLLGRSSVLLLVGVRSVG